ncbi:hypothetical protein FNV43_RR10808 [Rhamnella rubrinervis]|uniref:Uncharacterized protein n=1 Tax=Rhamnella rubrinervis TaxID=2594499 RepID=A0A8K0H4J4_9ROSA|nr:hypothetical protein FNV43_RR10808 [Rhamnella rubrinervis]
MSKNVFNDSFPTNAQEEGGSSNINNHGGVVETRTAGIPSNREWIIRRKVEEKEIRNGKLKFHYHETLDEVYTLQGGNKAVKSSEDVSVLLYDVTDGSAVEYQTSLLKAPSGVPFGLRWVLSLEIDV